MRTFILKFVSKVLVIVMVSELVLPCYNLYALTTGPSTPEVQGFEPVGTTDMVDPFSGDFTYNIPLMDVEGYPINLAYHSGINIEDEASWVGLGWNINPGQINRSVRGYPDDFKRDSLYKYLNIKDEIEVGLASEISLEVGGYKNASIGFGTEIVYNNYKGIGIGLTTNLGLKTPFPIGGATAGIGFSASANSLNGATLDANAYAGISKTVQETQGSISLNGSVGYNSRAGLRDPSFGLAVNFSQKKPHTKDSKSYRGGELVSDNRYNQSIGGSVGSSIPVGLQNFSPAISNSMIQVGSQLGLKAGAEFAFTYPHLGAILSKSVTSYQQEGSLPAYGYLHLDEGNHAPYAALDFTRDKDGIYNKTHTSLPMANLTYDLLYINGQGTGGNFRAFRNDWGLVTDPKIDNYNFNKSDHFEVGGPLFVANGLLEAGANTNITSVYSKSGLTTMSNSSILHHDTVKRFGGHDSTKYYQKYYFKNGGELTKQQHASSSLWADHAPVVINNNRYTSKNNNGHVTELGKFSKDDRASRASNIRSYTNERASITGIGYYTKLRSYNALSSNNRSITYSLIDRYSSKLDKAKKHHIGEYHQKTPDGRTFVYALPAMNNITKEATFSVDAHPISSTIGVTSIDGNDKLSNKKGTDHYFQATYTPAYAYSYLLTAVLSADYIDITGDGPTEDDIGTYTVFNYRRINDDYRWMAPYDVNGNAAIYNEGKKTDKGDDKASYTLGSKELWYLHSIETKNQIAEFYTSERLDALGVTSAIIKEEMKDKTSNYTSKLDAALSTAGKTYKLDTIKLFNKHDRYTNPNTAAPIKTIAFSYTYDLCPQTPNSNAANKGKLTLKKLHILHGNSKKGLFTPYEFHYPTSQNDGNAPYSILAKDRWGNYNPNNRTGLSNFEYPYTYQDKNTVDKNIKNWHMNKISLPTGGELKIDYESDDYAFVQDKRAMEMFLIEGVGNSPTFKNGEELYQSLDNQYNYIYFKRDLARENSALSFEENYFDKSQLLYFSALTDISGENKYEPIKGYAKVDSIGISNNEYGFIKLKKELSGAKVNKLLNPLTLAALNYSKMYLSHVLFPGYNKGEGFPNNIKEAIKGLEYAKDELFKSPQNLNNNLVKENKCRYIKPNQSWIRLTSPGYTKLGGGIRVKKLELVDNWTAMNSSGVNSSYGKVYDYTIKDEKTGVVISSGVAINEPFIGGDENALKYPEFYTESSGKLLPPVVYYKELPLGESIYPGASVGYSKVTVKSLHHNTNSRSSKYEDVHEYYTAKDFPIRIEKTDVKNLTTISNVSFFNREQVESVAQGYTMFMNDMHGKLKTNANYVSKDDKLELIKSVVHKYKTDRNGKLNNTVKGVSRNALSDGFRELSVADVKLGEEVDFTYDYRYNYNKMTAVGVNANLNVVNFAFVVIPFPSFFGSFRQSKTEFASQVATKVVHQYGILEKVETRDHGALTINENSLYDAETGKVLLTKVNNEYNDIISSATYPAYWAENQLGHAYENENLVFNVDTAIVDSSFYMNIKASKVNNRLNVGDKLYITYQITNNNVVDNFSNVLFVIDNGFVLNQLDCSECGTECTYKLQPRKIFNDQQATSPWHRSGTVMRNIKITVLESGKKNDLLSDVYAQTFLGELQNITHDNFFNLPLNQVLDVSIKSYKKNPLIENIFVYPFSNGKKIYNDIVTGLKNKIIPNTEFVYNTDRNYGNNHSRIDGLFNINNKLYIYNNYNLLCRNDNSYLTMLTNGNNIIKGSNIDKIDNYGNVLQQTTNTNVKSSIIYGFNQSVVKAIINNNKQNHSVNQSECKFYDYEDLQYLRSVNMHELGVLTNTTRVSQGNSNSEISVSQFNPFIINNRNYYVPTKNAYFSNTNILLNNIISHTGNYSLEITTPGTIYELGNRLDFDTRNEYIISFWIKSRIANQIVRAPMLNIQSYFNGILSNESNYDGLKIVTKSIDGWYKVEGIVKPKYVYPQMFLDTDIMTGKLGLHILDPCYIDDLRVTDAKANMISYVYDTKTLRLRALLDENNFATVYEYDEQGALVRTKKETEQGFLTISENRKSNFKK